MGRVIPFPATAAFDEDGFLINPRAWSDQMARSLAEEDGIGHLTAEHWLIIGFLREHYLRTGALAPMSHACHASGLEPCCVPQLFRSAREAWRIAGLPNPGEEAKAYM